MVAPGDQHMPPTLDPTPDLPDNTPTECVRLPPRIRNALRYAELNTIGAVRQVPDEELLRMPHLGRGSLAYLRKTLGARAATKSSD
jgi:DNA-directed RNA polymerase alpha subunit